MTTSVKFFLNKKDFETQVKISVVLCNTSTHTEVLDSSKIQLVEIDHKAVLIQVPPKTCAPGQWILLYFFSDQRNLKFKNKSEAEKLCQKENGISATGKVLELPEGTSDGQTVRVELSQFNENSWKKIIGKIEQKQSDLNALLRKVQDD